MQKINWPLSVKAYFWAFNFYWFFSPYPFARKTLSWLLTFLVTFEIKTNEPSNFVSFTRLFGLSRAPWISTWILGSSCQFLQKRKMEFSHRQHWIWGSIWESCRLKSIVFWSMNMGCCSIYFFQQIFEVFSIQMSLVLLLKDLFLDFLFFWCYCTWNCFPN